MKELILRIISERAVSRRDLLEALRLNGQRVSDREMRDTIHRMITEDGYCIQSSSRGYELVTTREQLNGAVRYIESYLLEFAERKRKLIENFERQGVAQMELFV